MKSRRATQPDDADQPGERAAEREQWSYLLRLWRSGDGWRASLHSVQTGEQHLFADLETLLAFLREHGHNRDH